MLKILFKLEWDRLLKALESYVVSDFVKEACKSLNPNFTIEKAFLLQEKSKYLWELIEKGKDLELPSLRSLKRLFNKALKRSLFLPVDLVEIKKWFSVFQKISIFVENSPFSYINSLYKELAYIEKILDRVLDCERGEIRDNASYQLYVIRKRIKEAQELLISKLEKIKEHFYKKGYLQDNLFTQREGRYVLPVKAEYKNKVRGILHEVSQSGATVFIEPVGIVSLSNEIEDLKYKEQREIIKVLKEVSEVLFQHTYEFCQLEEEYVEFEITLAKVKLGRSYRGVFPDLKERGILKIISGVHPLLVLKENQDKKIKPVCNDFIVEQGLLISGPNLGGKTVSLKTIGLLVLMAQTGFPVPAKFAEVPVFSKVFVDMGDDQDIFQGESSFSSHLRNLKEILIQADDKSLILLDEPGKGTSPEEGMALASAVVEELLNRGAKVVLTTHSQSLKAIALRIKNLKIAKMEYNFDKKEPTYRLIYGMWGDSLAFDLARKIGIPERVLEKAGKYLKNKEYWDLKWVLEKELKRVEELKIKLEQDLKRLQLEKEELEKEKIRIKEEYHKKLEEKISCWDREFKKLLEQIRKRKGSYKAVLEEFNQFVKRVLEESEVEKNKDIKEGDTVQVIPFKKEGEVLRVKEKTVEVKIGSLKVEVPKNSLVKLGAKRETSGFVQIPLKEVQSSKEILSEERLKLLGFTVEEALASIEKKLNQAFLEGIKKIYLIHGHGSGRLRSAVRKYLKGHPLVKNFEFAKPWEGGTGVTIVYLEEKN